MKCWSRNIAAALLSLILLQSACTPGPTAVPTRAATAVAAQPIPTNDRPLNSADSAPPATPTPPPTTTHTPTPVATATATATATPTPTATPIGPCSQRLPGDDLLAIVTLTYGLSRDFAPTDLVDLNDVLPPAVTLGYATEIRAIIAEPLAEMIADMQAAGLQPQVLSGYRSYSAQAFAWDKWSREFPDRAHILSAPPGHSEHQLGTTVDFGSPELASIIGNPDLQFHTYFYQTSEGAWLLENAQRYGFTLSYPLEAFEITGFYYEPWHYRYVGVDMAAQLQEMDMSLTEYLLATEPEPCIPD